MSLPLGRCHLCAVGPSALGGRPSLSGWQKHPETCVLGANCLTFSSLKRLHSCPSVWDVFPPRVLVSISGNGGLFAVQLGLEDFDSRRTWCSTNRTPSAHFILWLWTVSKISMVQSLARLFLVPPKSVGWLFRFTRLSLSQPYRMGLRNDTVLAHPLMDHSLDGRSNIAWTSPRCVSSGVSRESTLHWRVASFHIRPLLNTEDWIRVTWVWSPSRFQ